MDVPWESVLYIPEKGRNTLFILSDWMQDGVQVLCDRGKLVFVRNLTSTEIIGQIMAMEYLGEQKITNIVFMGIGEPVDNLDTLLHTLEIMKNPLGLDFSHRG